MLYFDFPVHMSQRDYGGLGYHLRGYFDELEEEVVVFRASVAWSYLSLGSVSFNCTCYQAR